MENEKLDLLNKSAHISSLNKTPVTIVQEYASKRQLCPQYDLVHNGTKDPVVSFSYRLTLEDYETIGKGSSKKEAKHVAALHLLQLLMNDKPQLIKNEFKHFDINKNVVSPYEKNIKENAVGQLNDICSNLKIKLPEFKEVREEGQAHAKLFTISCCVGKLCVEAPHKTKQQAKQLAAHLMVQKLMAMDKSLIITPSDTSNVNPMKVLEKIETIKSNQVKLSPPMDEDMSNYHLLFKKNDWPKTDTLNKLVRQICCDSKLNVSNPVTLLNEVVKECDMLLQQKIIDQDFIRGSKNNCYFMFSIENVYPTVFGLGVGNDIETAKNEAALDLIANICLLYK
ncbi:interferon-inducible double-stranded RNA-dependent protein kinase activator A homolog [Daktulosphaira vitifoliae]|uniref:interferon-inducible double-stranded RNA-dependent protein kinase activator A homolog n=1 Tax=Daktulosphaira vitifoliae TaxID=58002 RepID=UPI0021AAEC82|nr:interferon-inducible double-stranded RNA-dependent protein kinase activator A homolog [Daktulosphaira vitifoliae]